MTARQWLSLGALIASLALVYLLTTGGHLYSPDEEVMFRATEALVTRGSLAIDPMPQGFGTRLGRNDGQYPQYGLGTSLAAVPLYLVGGGLTHVCSGESLRAVLNTSSLINEWRYDYASPGDYIRRFAVAHTNVVVTLLQVAVIFFFALNLSGHLMGAILTALVYALATEAWPHGKTFFSEPLATLCLTAGAYFLWTGHTRPSMRRLWFAGALLGYAVFTRLDSVVAFPGLAVMALLLQHEGKGKSAPSPLRRHIASAIPVALFLMLILILNTLKFGGPFSTGYEDQPEGFHFNASLMESVPGFLWSPGRSLLFHSPPVILGLFGFAALFRKSRPLAVGVLVAMFTTFLFHAKWQNWSGGWDWGPRHIFSLIAWSMIPLGALLHADVRLPVRLALPVLFAIGLGVQALAISQNPLEFFDVFYARGEYARIAMREGRDMGELVRMEREGRTPAVWSWKWSPWDGYRRMWGMGLCDLHWVRTLRWHEAQREAEAQAP